MRDWIHAQMSLLATEQVKIETVFLPYLMTDGTHILAETIQQNIQKYLPKFETE